MANLGKVNKVITNQKNVNVIKNKKVKSKKTSPIKNKQKINNTSSLISKDNISENNVNKRKKIKTSNNKSGVKKIKPVGNNVGKNQKAIDKAAKIMSSTAKTALTGAAAVGVAKKVKKENVVKKNAKVKKTNKIGTSYVKKIEDQKQTGLKKISNTKGNIVNSTKSWNSSGVEKINKSKNNNINENKSFATKTMATAGAATSLAMASNKIKANKTKVVKEEPAPKKNFLDKAKDWACTGVAAVGSVFSGITNMVGKLTVPLEFVAWGSAKAVTYITNGDQSLIDDAFKGVMKKTFTIGSNVQEAFYKTDVGKELDEHSKFKFKSKANQNVQKVSEIGASIVPFLGALKFLGAGAKLFTIGYGAYQGFGTGVSEGVENNGDFEQVSLSGGLNSLWGAGTSAIGVKIAGMGGTAAKEIGIRIGADTALGALDPIAETGIETLYNRKSYNKNFKENGGWASVGVSAALSGAMSAGGELSGLRAKFKERTGANNTTKSFRTKINDKFMSFSKKSKNYFNQLKANSKGGFLDFDELPGFRNRAKRNVEADYKVNNDIIQESNLNIQQAIDATLKKQGYEINTANREKLLSKINSGNYNAITSDNNWRNVVKNMVQRRNTAMEQINIINNRANSEAFAKPTIDKALDEINECINNGEYSNALQKAQEQQNPNLFNTVRDYIYNIKPWEKDSFVAISDFHGAKFMQDKVETSYFSEYDKIFCLGDITDRGADSLSLLRRYKTLSEKYPDKYIYIPGNHDTFIYGHFRGGKNQAMYDRLIELNSFKTDKATGLKIRKENTPLDTIEEMENLFKTDPKEFDNLLNWLGNRPIQAKHIYNGKKYAYAHAFFNERIYNQNPNLNLKDLVNNITPATFDSDLNNILWFRRGQNSYNLNDLPSSDTKIIVGHTPNEKSYSLENSRGEQVNIFDVDGAASSSKSGLKFDSNVDDIGVTKAEYHVDTSKLKQKSFKNTMLRNNTVLKYKNMDSVTLESLYKYKDPNVKIEVDGELYNIDEVINMKLLDQQMKLYGANGLKGLQNSNEVVNYVKDPKQYLLLKYGDDIKSFIPMTNDIENLMNNLSNRITDEDLRIINNMLSDKNSLYNQANNLNIDEKNALGLYSGMTGHAINSYIIGIYDRDYSIDELLNMSTNYFNNSLVNKGYENNCIKNYDYLETVNHLDSAINKSVLNNDCTLIRGVDSDFNGLNINLSEIKPGFKISTNAYSSCSLNTDNVYAQEADIIYEILAPKGTHASYVQANSGMGIKSETKTGYNFYSTHEVLLGRNTKFEVTDYPRKRKVEKVQTIDVNGKKYDVKLGEKEQIVIPLKIIN